MASLSFDEVSGNARIHFRFAGKQIQKSLKTNDRKKAASMKAQIEEMLHDLERGRTELPANADLWEFLKSGGIREQKLRFEDVLTLEGLFKWYFDQVLQGTKEPKTLSTEHVHERHFLRILGRKSPLPTISEDEIRKYIAVRANESPNGRSIRSETIEKEIKTLQMIWNQAVKRGMVRGKAPTSDQNYPKKKKKPPFQTWEEIEQTISRGGLSEFEKSEQWRSLFLSKDQIEEILEFVRTKQTRNLYFYPLIMFAAHTGARLSEIMRSKVSDFVFDVNIVRLWEKKKDKTQETYRNVPMSTKLGEVMTQYWDQTHPGGVYSICRKADSPMLESTLHEAFKWFFRSSKWSVLHGYHIFRHSFASNLARIGEDQRVIDGMMGHQTDEMRLRYRHLFPEQIKNAIKKLFG